jgi:hypothetical protein
MRVIADDQYRIDDRNVGSYLADDEISNTNKLSAREIAIMVYHSTLIVLLSWSWDCAGS